LIDKIDQTIKKFQIQSILRVVKQCIIKNNYTALVDRVKRIYSLNNIN